MQLYLFLLIVVQGNLYISLDTKWKSYTSSSLIQEISEFLSESNQLWSFLEHDLSMPLETLIAEVLPSPIEQSLLYVSLHNREFASRLEFYSQVQKLEQATCWPFFIINSKLSCSISEELASPAVQLNSTFDHIYREGFGHIIAYLDISHPDFRDLHKKVISFSERHNLTYALRHLDVRKNGPDYLGGFGAELIMKNMEYNPTEDLNLKYVPLEKWNTENVCKKALSYILKLKDLESVRSVLDNLPDYAEKIVNTNIDKKVERELEKLAYSQVQTKNTLLINNQEASLDLFNSLKVLRKEIRALKLFEEIGLPKDVASIVQSFSNLYLRSYQSKSKAIKTTYTTGRVYLNDLETDNKYKDLPQSPEAFLFSYGSDIPPVALNLLNVVLICDITSEYCFKTLQNLIEMLDDIPFHLGLILTGDTGMSTIVLEGIRNLKKIEEDLPFEFLESIRFGMSPEEVEQTLRTLCRDCEIDFEYSYMGKRCQSFCDTVGLCGPAQIVLNGRVLEFDELDLGVKDVLQENLFYEFLKEKRTVTGLAMRGYIEPPLEAFFEKVKYMNTSERINLGISEVSSSKLSISKTIPQTAVGWKSEDPQGFFYLVLNPDDIDLFKTALDFKERASDLKLNFLFLFNFNEIKEDWAEALKSFPFEYSLDLMRSEIKEKSLSTSCVIINSRVIPKVHFKNYRDFYIALETETSRLNTNELAGLLPSRDLLERTILTVLSGVSTPEVVPSKPTSVHSSLKQSLLTKSYLNPSSLFEVHAVVNIDNSECNKILSICSWLFSLGASVTVTYTSSLTDQKFPLYTYYQYLIKTSFSDSLEFSFNQSHTYTVNLDVHNSWMVRPSVSDKDLDNLYVTSDFNISFSLKSILIQGQCSQTKHGMHAEPPNGLQLTLYSDSKLLSDTIVMKNFGYFQFQAHPGTFQVGLAEGRSDMLFDIKTGGKIYLKDVASGINIISVSKKDGKENEELLEVSKKDNGDTIHVFSLASGRLYERLIKIMMTSVMKFTQSKVKFWLFEDFFSPNFSDGIQVLSEALGFEYELLSYKWPSWLYRQTEKQRIIWGYKILFLDVLFPIKLNRVIYIDADQVVRADIKELWELDLQGAPYAYTPFCDSNLEAAKFMFWKDGYWKNHLRGLPYHISALYVVDLNVFRNLGAGDILRYFYESLAPNPDSLSNLDQDLPNFAQTHLKIFSLPQEWLWCASWCSAESQKDAKSIDLCNNPLTRQHKIEAAKTYIPEWQEYDDFVSSLAGK